MNNQSKISLAIAALLVPVIMPVMIYATFVFIFGSDLDKDHGIKTGIRAACWVAYGIGLALGIACYVWMRLKKWHSLYHFIGVGLFLGFVSWLLFSLVSLSMVGLLFFIFASAGLMMGTLFWFMVFFQPDGSHSRSSRRRRRRH